MKTNSKILETTPTRFRTAVARGLTSAGEIDRTGGDYGAGIIRGVAIVTRGEALGHDLWVDAGFLAQVESAMREKPAGVRARFTHPNASGDGLGRKLGRMKFASRDRDVVRGDLHFSQSSHTTPEGDLAAYVMGLAEEDPDLFGASVAFERDYEAEEVARSSGVTDDPSNPKKLPPVRLARLTAVDVVDEPAANPGGLFHVGEIPAEAEALADYIFGLADTAPDCESLRGIHPERVRAYFSRFMAQHGLKLEQRKLSVKTKPEPWDAFTAALGDRGLFWFSAGVSVADAVRLSKTEFGRKIERFDAADQLPAAKLPGGCGALDLANWIALGAFPGPTGKAKNKFGVLSDVWSVKSLCVWAAAGCPDKRGRANKQVQAMVGTDRPREY